MADEAQAKTAGRGQRRSYKLKGPDGAVVMVLAGKERKSGETVSLYPDQIERVQKYEASITNPLKEG